MPIKMLTINRERWGDVPGFPNYKVSTFGRIWGKKLNQLSKPALTMRGYRQMDLYNNGKRKSFKVHRLVLLVFLGPCPNGLETAHYDGNRQNNHFDNLLYTTSQNNNFMKRRHNTLPVGENVSTAKLTEKEVLSIRKEYCRGVRGFGLKSLSKKYGVKAHSIRQIIHGNHWKHLL